MRIVPVFGYGLRGRWRQVRRRPADWVMCGLVWRHGGACVPFVPGCYLRAPLAHPLDLWLAWRPRQPPRCPDGCPTRCVDVSDWVHNMTWEDGGWVLYDVAAEWRFTPCGHAFREIWPADLPFGDG